MSIWVRVFPLAYLVDEVTHVLHFFTLSIFTNAACKGASNWFQPLWCLVLRLISFIGFFVFISSSCDDGCLFLFLLISSLSLCVIPRIDESWLVMWWSVGSTVPYFLLGIFIEIGPPLALWHQSLDIFITSFARSALNCLFLSFVGMSRSDDRRFASSWVSV